MKIKRKIIRLLITMMWVILAAGLTVLLVAAIDIKNHKTCTQVQISISGAKEFFFLNRHDILQMITRNGLDRPVGKPIDQFDLQHLEIMLEKNVWIKDARLFFDNNLVLHVAVSEREPVARIFDQDGSSFYIDSTGFIIPLSSKKKIMRLPVFTGFPAKRVTSHQTDSVLMMHIKDISRHMLKDSFWMAQIAQIDITAQKTFDMLPTLGNHVIEFGDGQHYESKFNRLFVFYKKVLAPYGFDRYSKISVQYSSQVVGTKRGEVSRIDSLQALQNIRKMIEDAKVVLSDSVLSSPASSMPAVNKIPADTSAHIVKDSSAHIIKKQPVKAAAPVKQPVAAPKKIRETDATKPKAAASGVKPKAVMPKLNDGAGKANH